MELQQNPFFIKQKSPSRLYFTLNLFINLHVSRKKMFNKIAAICEYPVPQKKGVPHELEASIQLGLLPKS